MACPHVAGTLALNLAGDIYGSADDLAPAGWDEYTGFGLVDAGESATGIPNYGDDLAQGSPTPSEVHRGRFKT